MTRKCWNQHKASKKKHYASSVKGHYVLQINSKYFGFDANRKKMMLILPKQFYYCHKTVKPVDKGHSKERQHIL